MEKLSTFDMEIIHKKGKDKIAADALSRKDEEVKAYATTIVILDWLDEIRVEYAKDSESNSIINNLDQNPKFEWKNDILWYKNKIYLIPSSKFKMKVLRESHSSPTSRHVDFFKTYYNARQSFYWKGMDKDIQRFVVECEICRRNKNENVMTLGLLHPLHIPEQKWEEISMDFIEGLPMFDGKDKIFVVVDRLTKYAHFIAVRKIDSTKQIADVFCKTFISYMGFRR
jgi:hypothetical protein